jgi:hypothetical protein
MATCIGFNEQKDNARLATIGSPAIPLARDRGCAPDPRDDHRVADVPWGAGSRELVECRPTSNRYRNERRSGEKIELVPRLPGERHDSNIVAHTRMVRVYAPLDE